MKIVDHGPADVALITPTRDRIVQFAFVERWIAKQDYPGTAFWIVVDDGVVPCVPTLGQRHRRVDRDRPLPQKAMTIPDNLLAGLDDLETEIFRHGQRAARYVLVIEDDDWYRADYVSRMVEEMSISPVAGLADHIYYDLSTRRYRAQGNVTHASLCCTGFRVSMVPSFRRVVEWCRDAGNQFIDDRFWNYGYVAPSDKNVFPDNRIQLGLKRWPTGTPNAGPAWGVHHDSPHDPDWSWLRAFMGGDAGDVIEYVERFA